MFITRLDGNYIDLQYAPINTSSALTITIDGEETTEDSEWEKVGISTDPYINFFGSTSNNVSITYTTSGIDDDTVKQGILAILYSIYENEPIMPHIWSILKPHKKVFI